MIAESGVLGLSLRAVARRFGATTGMVSHHFLDRAELVSAALDYAAGVMINRLVDHAGVGDPATVTPPFDVLAAVLPTDAVTIENWRFALSVRAAALSDHDFLAFDRRITDHWSNYLPERLRATGVTEAADAADFLIAVVDGIALRATTDPGAWPAERQLRHLRRAFDGLDRT